MLIEISQAVDRHYDLCIIGAGPAGIILALEYAGRNHNARVLLVEGGRAGLNRNRLDDTIQVRNPKNHHLPYDCTNKGLGGSSLTWGGRCVMYDDVDFVPHGPVQQQCTWTPEFQASVTPFLEPAADYFKCGEPIFDARQMPGPNVTPLAENFQSGPITDNSLERWSLPTRFGKEYGKQIRQHRRIDYLEAFIATRLLEPNEAGEMEAIEVEPLAGGATCRLTARAFAICAGGQESTRLLLKSPQLFQTLGGPPPSLGRYYQGHVSGKIAYVRFYGDPNLTQFGFIRDSDGVYCRRRFQLTKEAIVENKLLNIAFWLDNPPIYDAAHGSGTLSLIYLALRSPVLGKRLLPPAIALSLRSNYRADTSRHVLNILRGMPGSIGVPAAIFARRYLCRRSLPGVFLKSASNRYALHFHCEQVPSETNRMMLAQDGETLVIDYQYSDDDVDAVIRGHRLLDQELRSMNCGELEYVYPTEDLPQAIRSISMDGLHQMGTIRIANSPRDGVVDTDLRVWGTGNVYVCSSAVFPTSGQANPTFFLGACAVRLAAHLASCQATRVECRVATKICC